MTPSSAIPSTDGAAPVGFEAPQEAGRSGTIAKLSDYRPVPAVGHMPFRGFKNCRETRLDEHRRARIEAYKRMIEEM